VGHRPFRVAVTDLVRRPGSRKPVRIAAPLDGLAISTAAAAPGEDVVADLELESLSNGIVASGTLTVAWVGACRRCLDPVHDVAVTEVREIFERRPVEGETYPLDGDIVDLAPMVRDAALLALPLAPLCSSVCRGPDAEGLPVAVEGEGPGDDAADEAGDGAEGATRGGGPDPRWAALDRLTFD
jgi:uncharacterized protein